jgi:hypothetical protein
VTLSLYRKRTPRRRPEAQLQKAVVQHLMLAAMPGVLWFAVPNEGKRSARAGLEAKRMGLRPGVADLCIIVWGMAHFLELKAPSGKLSDAQRDFANECGARSIPWECAFDIEAALSILADWRAIKPTSSRRAE